MDSKLLAIYAQIPAMHCEQCGDCCGPVPFLPQEAKACGREVETDFSLGPCEFLKDGKCSVYENRPFMCRLFGTADQKYLQCPRGHSPKRKITAKKAAHLTKQYHAMHEKGE